MKKLELNQMENVQGGEISQRNCGILGVGIVVGSVIGVFNPIGWGLAITSFGAAAASDCF
ncbi:MULTISPECIES: hypothetical protein [Capnocytophaga]|uniref:hypothetical protein n=1 Tax=Capnocytophaga TaxID=1016 RepID=UPI000BB16C10|nr:MULTISPECIES: hypothetical protein [Capnocytophaga]ATA74696.1 hypothetical protein CGC52_04140 [Capnocytophaga sp. H2931]